MATEGQAEVNSVDVVSALWREEEEQDDDDDDDDEEDVVVAVVEVEEEEEEEEADSDSAVVSPVRSVAVSVEGPVCV